MQTFLCVQPLVLTGAPFSSDTELQCVLQQLHKHLWLWQCGLSNLIQILHERMTWLYELVEVCLVWCACCGLYGMDLVRVLLQQLHTAHRKDAPVLFSIVALQVCA